MARILITSGPTREYLDPVRFLTNASSGRMGQALAQAALDAGYEVTVISGPVQVEYPTGAEVINVVSTTDMLNAGREHLARAVGVIAAAAPCDYAPRNVADDKLKKTGQPLQLELVETPDVIGTLAGEKSSQWVVAFALETSDGRRRALEKLRRKGCDLIVLNGPAAMHSEETSIEVLAPDGQTVLNATGSKADVASQIIALVGERFSG